VEHTETFATGPTNLGYCDILQHDIDTGDTFPIKQTPCCPPLAVRQAEDEIINEMLASGVIEPSESPWASHVCLVQKKDCTYRFCVDYRRVNAVSKGDAFPIPDIHDACIIYEGLSHLRFDVWLLAACHDRRCQRTFCILYTAGLFQFIRMPFGLAGVPASFYRLMSIVFKHHLDDIIVFARTPQELLQHLRIVLNRL